MKKIVALVALPCLVLAVVLAGAGVLRGADPEPGAVAKTKKFLLDSGQAAGLADALARRDARRIQEDPGLTEDQKKKILEAVRKAVSEVLADRMSKALGAGADGKALDAANAFYATEEGRKAAEISRRMFSVIDEDKELEQAARAAMGKAVQEAVPELAGAMKNRRNESSAIASLKTIVTAEEQFKATSGKAVYASLAEMSGMTPPYIDFILGKGEKNGYKFDLVVATPADANWYCTANPLQGGPKARHFFVDASGVIRFKLGAPASSADSAIE